MAIKTDKEGLLVLKSVIARRLKASRRAARLSEPQVAARLNQKGVTQISLWESGDRTPSLQDLVKCADIYSVPLDFLVGRIDDPIAEGDESNQSLIAREVTRTIEDNFKLFANAIAQQAGVCISGHREERRELRELLGLVSEIEHAFQRILQLNPEYDDLAGGSTLMARVKKAGEIKDRVALRLDNESRQVETIEKALRLEEIGGKIKQFQLALVV